MTHPGFVVLHIDLLDDAGEKAPVGLVSIADRLRGLRYYGSSLVQLPPLFGEHLLLMLQGLRQCCCLLLQDLTNFAEWHSKKLQHHDLLETRQILPAV